MLKTKYKYVRVPIRTKRRTRPRERQESYGLFSGSDIGFGGMGSNKEYAGVGSFDFGFGSGKQVTPKQKYLAEKKSFNQTLENERYSAKLKDVQSAKARYDKAKRDELIFNARQGFGRLTNRVQKIIKR